MTFFAPNQGEVDVSFLENELADFVPASPSDARVQIIAALANEEVRLTILKGPLGKLQTNKVLLGSEHPVYGEVRELLEKAADPSLRPIIDDFEKGKKTSQEGYYPNESTIR